MEELFHQKLIRPEEALGQISSGARVVLSMAATEPQVFLEGLAQRARTLEGLQVYCANPSKAYECFQDPELKGRLEIYGLFLTAPVRSLQGHGVFHYIPQHLSHWSRNILRRGEVDFFWGSASLPDSRGYVSLSLSNCYESEILRKAKKVILELNPKLPYSYGDGIVHLSQVDHIYQVDGALQELKPAHYGAVEQRIAAYIAELVPDGATIQLGIGAIPNALTETLSEKKHLGVHTELINDAIMQLALKGVIDGSAKTLWPHKIIGSFILGSAELYEFIHQNSAVELYPSRIVNDPQVIRKNSQMISINTAVEIDITGQVCSESIGHRELSGVGGATDTHLGAQLSPGGRGIIALASTTRDAEYSKIVIELKPGAKISISRNDIDTVVTEYGVASLKGLSVGERAHSLIQIAHPRFREELRSQAIKWGYI